MAEALVLLPEIDSVVPGKQLYARAAAQDLQVRFAFSFAYAPMQGTYHIRTYCQNIQSFCAIKQVDNCDVIVKSVPQHIISLNMCTNKQITQQIKQNLNRDLCLVWKTI